MQRVTQMNVTPDLIASISPSADVRVSISGEDTVPGVFVLPSQVSESRLDDRARSDGCLCDRPRTELQYQPRSSTLRSDYTLCC